MDQTEWTRVVVLATAVVSLIGAVVKLRMSRHEGKKHPESAAMRQTSRREVEDLAYDEATGRASAGDSLAMNMAAQAMEQASEARAEVRDATSRFNRLYGAYQEIHGWSYDVYTNWSERREREEPPPWPWNLPDPDRL